MTTLHPSSSNGPALRMVVQRYRHAKLLLDEREVVSVGRPCLTGLLLPQSPSPFTDDADTSSSTTTAGLLVYISFAKTATRDKVEQAAQTLLNMSVLTLGAWGDGSGTQSLLQLPVSRYHQQQQQQQVIAMQETNTIQNPPENEAVSSRNHSPLSLILVPQANVTAKVKKLGKSIQYRDQIAKSEGEALYHFFVETIHKLLIKQYAACRQSVVGTSAFKNPKPPKGNKNGGGVPDPSIPPKDLFHQDPTRYGSYDDDNVFPLTRLASGESLTKSARKKLQKVYEAHVKRHSKFLEKGEVVAAAPSISSCITTLEEEEMEKIHEDTSSPSPTSKHETSLSPVLSSASSPCFASYSKVDPSFVQVVAGSFGKRQGLELQSDMGPFCHVVEL